MVLSRLLSPWTLLGLLAAAAYWWFSLPPTPPVDAAGNYRYADYQLHTLQPFDITGRVLSTKVYRWDREAQLAPLDIALGWGPMSEPSRIEALQVTQGNRWFYWRAAKLPLPRAQLESNMANIHIVPANDGVRAAVLNLQPGDMVELRGELIEAVGADGWRWRSSLSRTDTGDGSCELLLLHSIRRTATR